MLVGVEANCQFVIGFFLFLLLLHYLYIPIGF